MQFINKTGSKTTITYLPKSKIMINFYNKSYKTDNKNIIEELKSLGYPVVAETKTNETMKTVANDIMNENIKLAKETKLSKEL